jgi:hypothetical protein
VSPIHPYNFFTSMLQSSLPFNQEKMTDYSRVEKGKMKDSLACRREHGLPGLR